MALSIIMQLMVSSLSASIAKVKAAIIAGRDVLNRIVIVPHVAGIALGAEFDEGHWL